MVTAWGRGAHPKIAFRMGPFGEVSSGKWSFVQPKSQLLGMLRWPTANFLSNLVTNTS